MTEISIFIPVYKDSELLPAMLDKLVLQNVTKEIFVTIDAPSKHFLENMRRFNKVKFIINEERIGKANALNNAVKLSSGRVLLFLDADIKLRDDPDFLKKIIEEMKHTDVLDIKKKVVRNSFLSKMTYYEYFAFNIGAWIASKYLQRCPAANGAAFAIKRETFDAVDGFRTVVAEDLDIATRAFMDNHSFAYTKEVEVRSVVYSDWKDWINQRKRWAIGLALWLKEWYRDLLKKFVEKPQIFLPALYCLYPSVILLFLGILMPNTWMYKLLLVFSLFLSVQFNFALPVFVVSIATADLLKNLLISISSFAAISILFFSFSRKLGFEMKIHELVFYYFFYSLLGLIIMIIGLVQVFIFKKNAAPDWKT